MDLREVAKPERERERERGNDGRVEISSGEENVEGGASVSLFTFFPFFFVSLPSPFFCYDIFR